MFKWTKKNYTQNNNNNQQGSQSISRPFGQYFDGFEGSSNELPEYVYLVFTLDSVFNVMLL